MKFYTDGFYLHAELHQNRSDLPCLLMLHGFMGSGKLFSQLTESLKDVCNPLTIDLAGHGESESPNDPSFFSADNQVKQIASVLSLIQPDNLFGYGYSMGGRLLFQLLITHLNLFRGAVVESSHCGITNPAERKQRVLVDEKRASEIESGFPEFIDRWLELPLFSETPEKQKLDYKSQMLKQNPGAMASSLRQFGAGVMPPVCEKLRNLHLPLYLVAGSKDLKYEKRMAGIEGLCKNAELKVIENAGHRVHADNPEKLTEIIKTFLKQNHV